MTNSVGATVLVVEDNPALQELMVMTLNLGGYSATGVGDGRDAIAALELQPYDVVLTDVVMPYRNGFEVLDTTRKRWPLTNVVLITGAGRTSPLVYINSAAKLGAKATLTKPFTPETLLATVRSVLGAG